MTEPPSPSIAAAALHRVSAEVALAFVDETFGAATEWPSGLVSARLSEEFHADWKEEVGHWLKSAERLGFLEPLADRIIKRARRGTRSVGIDPNDKRHNELVAELAPARVAHYLVGTGWSFLGWEPITGGSTDVDLSFSSPGGATAYIQVKAPGEPAGRANEFRSRVVNAVRKAAKQLPRDEHPVNLIAVCANRDEPLSTGPRCLVTELIGSTIGSDDGTCVLPTSRRGQFFDPDWRHVSGVVLLDYLRGIDTFRYVCTVLCNPVASRPGDPDWFPYARVCSSNGTSFEWTRGEPGRTHTLPHGTLLVED